MKIWTIYCHTLFDGRKYVGQTQLRMMKRWHSHRARITGVGSTNPFTTALTLYPAKLWTHEVLEECISQREADKAEATWIAKLQTCAIRSSASTPKRAGHEPRLDLHAHFEGQDFARPSFTLTS